MNGIKMEILEIMMCSSIENNNHNHNSAADSKRAPDVNKICWLNFLVSWTLDWHRFYWFFVFSTYINLIFCFVWFVWWFEQCNRIFFLFYKRLVPTVWQYFDWYLRFYLYFVSIVVWLPYCCSAVIQFEFSIFWPDYRIYF